MKLNEPDVYPENNTMHFAVKKKGAFSDGYVGIVLFKDENWYAMPGEREMKYPVDNFMWVEL